MGTPRLLASVDQIKNAQSTASLGGECQPTDALQSSSFRLATSGLGGTITGNATNVAFTL
jgi:hypothetical protein